ncbi:MAG: DUF4836 family protein [Bacteroidota bacterium]
MNSIKQFISIILLLVTFSSLQAQDLINLVPKETFFTGMLDINQINTKAKLEELIKLPLLEKMDKEIKEVFTDFIEEDSSNYLDLNKYGINTNSKSYFYANTDRKVFYGALIVALSDEARFENFIKFLTDNKKNNAIIATDNYKYIDTKDVKIVWNTNTASIFGLSIWPHYKDSIRTEIKKRYSVENKVWQTESGIKIEFDDLIEETEKTKSDSEQQEKNQGYKKPSYNIYSLLRSATDSVKKDWVKRNLPVLLKNKTKSLASNAEYVKNVKHNPDAAIIMDYGQFNQLYINNFKGLVYRSLGESLLFNNIMELYTGMKLFASLDFDKDKVELKSDVTYSKMLEDLYKDVKKKKISKKLLKYMDKDLMGYYAFGLDIEGVSKGVKSILKKTLPAVPKYGKSAVPAMEIIDIIIDEKALYNIFTGDMVLAVNGVKPMEVIHTTYDYDEEFNKVEITDTSVQTMPEVQMMLGIKNQTDIDKIFKLLTSLDFLRKEGNIYSVHIKHNKIPVFLSIHDDILFVSNNKSFIKSPVVYEKSKQPGKQHAKMFRKNTFVAFADIEKIAGYFAEAGFAKGEKNMLIETSKILSNIIMTGKTDAKKISGSYILELKKSEENSIVDLLTFLNSLYIKSGKRI